MGNKSKIYLMFVLLVLSLAVYGCDGSSGTTTPPQETFTINTTGGDGGPNGGYGRSAGYINIYMDYGSGGPIEVLKTGLADASFTARTVTANLGSNPLAVTADTTIAVVTAEPALGTPYLVANDYSLYISDGDGTTGDEIPVTGISVATGAILVLGLNYNVATGARISMSHDINNQGTITVLDDSATKRGDLRLYAASYFGNSMIATFGTQDGQSGGYVYMNLNGSFFNNGTINTSGYGSTTGGAGDGGYVNVYADYWFENTGNITTDGGTASGGGTAGGDAGYINLDPDLDMLNSGALSSRGGDGVTSGGNGGWQDLEVDWVGDLRNSGDLNTSGGDATGGNGGNGGDIDFDVDGGDIINSGDLTLTGGTTTDTASNGGSGGDIDLYLDEGYGAPGDVLFSGNIDTSGGDAVTTTGATGNGGYGGDIYMEGYYYGYPLGQRMAMLGYTEIDASGGDGNYGGDAEGLYIYNEYTWAGTYGPGGDITNEANLAAIGGSVVAGATASPANGGDGGWLDLETEYDYGMLDPDSEKVVNTGNINTSGGNSLESTNQWNGDGGYVYLWGYNGATNSGNITANGGNDSGTDGGTTGYGNYGGWIGFYTQEGPVDNSGTITANGGNGEYQGGDCSGFEFFGSQVTNSGALTSIGGNADAVLANATGGDGAWVEIFSLAGTSTQTGVVTNNGGTGTTAGTDGVYMLDGLIQ